jgi:hypothetical protein
MIILISFGRLDSAICILILLTFGIVPSGFRSSPLSFLGNIWFLIWTWHSVVVYIQFILKYLTLFPHPSIPYPHHQYQLPSPFVYSRSQQTQSYTANSSSLILLLSSFLCLSLFQFLPGITFEYGRTCTVEGSPYSYWMDLWQVRTTAARAISIPGFCQQQQYVPRGMVAHSPLLIGNGPILGAAPDFPILDDADLFPSPPLSYFLWEVDEGWLVMALALRPESLLGKNPHS